jgi:hypothetical protein
MRISNSTERQFPEYGHCDSGREEVGDLFECVPVD